ncbi:MAG: DUF371 domain-containing protein [Theionarchaea archaeon]|nr:DUF371 domain-containing protein [Theionarchaea archaeon]
MEITACGHENILATHPTTVEITREKHLTKRGDCIIGVDASHALADLQDTLIPLRGREVTLILSVDDLRDTITGYLHPDLKFTDDKVIIVRKSAFLCARTLLIHADKAARDINRDLIEKMKDPSRRMLIDICVRGT